MGQPTIYLAADVLCNPGWVDGMRRTTESILIEMSKTHKVVCITPNKPLASDIELNNNIQPTTLEKLYFEDVSDGVCLLPSNGVWNISGHTRYYILSKFLGKVPIISVIHDTAPDVLYEDAIRYDGGNLQDFHKWVQASIDASSAIVGVSDNTVADIKKYYDVGDRPVVRIYNGVEIHPMPRNVSDYYMYFGGFSYRKGLGTLVKAMVHLLNMGRNPYLLLLGRYPAPNFKRYVDMAIDTGLVKYLPVVDDDELVRLIAGAKTLIYPSVYEGFGMPVAEAMRCRCPVVVSPVSSMPEIAGNAAIYFEPENDADLAQKLVDFEDGVYDVPTLVENGYHKSLEFTWEESVRQYLQLCHTVYERGL